jgi:hypothetical protein
MSTKQQDGPALTPDQRRASRSLQEKARKTYETVTTELARRRAANLAKRREVEEEDGRIGGEEYTAGLTFTQARDSEGAKNLTASWPLFDKTLVKIDAEHSGLTVSRFDLPAQSVAGQHVLSTRQGEGEIVNESIGRALAMLDRTISNADSVARRAKALLDLRDALKDAVARAEVTTDAELEAWFTKAHAALPAIEPLEAVLARDIRGRHYLGAAVRIGAIPPSAA